MSSRASDHHVSTPTPTSGNTANNAHRIRRNRGPERPLDLTLDDGSVILPPAVASDVLRALVRDLTARVRADGERSPPTYAACSTPSTPPRTAPISNAVPITAPRRRPLPR